MSVKQHSILYGRTNPGCKTPNSEFSDSDWSIYANGPFWRGTQSQLPTGFLPFDARVIGAPFLTEFDYQQKKQRMDDSLRTLSPIRASRRSSFETPESLQTWIFRS